jgi:hypothetical protein
MKTAVNEQPGLSILRVSRQRTARNHFAPDMHALVPFKLLPGAFRIKPSFIGGNFQPGIFRQASAFSAVPTEFWDEGISVHRPS